jgi:transcriptional regulator with XRE-family HTH domain
MEDKQIYEKLREFRRARGISVDQLAKEMGENSQKVGRIERGQRSLTVDYLLKVSKALSTPLENFLDKQDSEDAVESSNSFDSNILNNLVVLIEDVSHKLPMEYTSQQKAKMISDLYEMILKLPNENRYSFFHLLSNCLNGLLQNR